MYKKYTEYMDEITSDELYKGLLAHGLFAEKLPPLLSSKAFYDHCITEHPKYEKGEHDYIVFNSMRNVNIPRQMGIPTPMAYERLCAGLRDNWDKLQEHFRNNTSTEAFKVSRIHIRKQHNSDRLFEMNYNDWREDGSPEDDILIGKRYLVNADISTCFPSIYTHSIPWALVGKDYAKVKENRKPELWFNQIDHLCQNTRNGETHGLIIGPHASNLISELILTVVDKSLVAHGWEYTRNIDDYSCLVSSADDAQRFITDLATQLRYFDLPLNYKKTKIQQLPLANTEQWVRKLNAFQLVAAHGKVDYLTARAFFDTAIELMTENSDNAAILNYAIKVLAKKDLTDNARVYCAKECMHLAVIYPYLITLVEEYVFKPYQVAKEDIKKYSEIAYRDGMHYGNFEETYYAIYFALRYGFELSVNTDDILATDSCILKLLGMLYYRDKDDKEWKKYRDHAKELKTKDSEMDRNWIFIYETLTFGNLAGEWRTLKQKGVSFLKMELLGNEFTA